eukprot:15444438-Alexandrium_andersonii.AAC.3
MVLSALAPSMSCSVVGVAVWRSCFGSRCRRRRVGQRAFPQVGVLALLPVWGPILPNCVWCLSEPLVEVVRPVVLAAWFWGRAA